MLRKDFYDLVKRQQNAFALESRFKIAIFGDLNMGTKSTHYQVSNNFGFLICLSSLKEINKFKELVGLITASIF